MVDKQVVSYTLNPDSGFILLLLYIVTVLWNMQFSGKTFQCKTLCYD